jgi:hypothetical protein
MRVEDAGWLARDRSLLEIRGVEKRAHDLFLHFGHAGRRQPPQTASRDPFQDPQLHARRRGLGGEQNLVKGTSHLAFGQEAARPGSRRRCVRTTTRFSRR